MDWGRFRVREGFELGASLDCWMVLELGMILE